MVNEKKGGSEIKKSLFTVFPNRITSITLTTSENTDEEMTGIIEIHVKKGVSEEEQDAITIELNNFIDDQEESITGSIVQTQ